MTGQENIKYLKGVIINKKMVLEQIANFFGNFWSLASDFIILIFVIIWTIAFFLIQYFLIKSYIWLFKFIHKKLLLFGIKSKLDVYFNEK